MSNGYQPSFPPKDQQPQGTPQNSGYIPQQYTAQGYNSIPEQRNAPMGYGVVTNNHQPQQLYRVPPTYSGPVAQNQYQSPQIYKNQGPFVPPEYVNTMRKSKTFNIIMLIISSFALLVLFGLATLLGGTVTFFLALVPLTLVVLATTWIGRWDPEPVTMRILAFVWGAVGSIILTFALGFLWSVVIPGAEIQFVGLAIQAPVIEEFSKGILILAIALFFRKYIDGPIDAIVYVMLSAAGFAFTENILYFINSLAAGGVFSLGLTFVLRGVMSPFAHALFSLPMGILVGIGVRKNFNPLQLIGMFFIGYLPAMLLHALWNGSSYLIPDIGVWFLFYLVVQLPLFLGAIFIIKWFRNQEALRTYRYLTEFAWGGWFNPQEVETLGTWRGRKFALRWAKNRGVNTIFLAKSLNKEVVDLTNLREDIVNGKNSSANLQKQQYLLQKISHDKKLLVSA
jgi:RsiW-degrading membrane proteinase PrsW (M82 family)